MAFDFPPRFLFYNRFYITAHRVRELDREIVKGVVSERRAEQEESAKNKIKYCLLTRWKKVLRDAHGYNAS